MEENPFEPTVEHTADVFEYDINQSREDFITGVMIRGYVVVYPKDNELQIDIDSEEHYAQFQKSAACFARNWEKDISYEAHPSKSGPPCMHITVLLPFDVEPWQRIALQAALGSDPIRELLSAVRIMKGDTAPTLFVENPHPIEPICPPEYK